MKKKVALLLTATVLAASLAGCAASGKEETAAANAGIARILLLGGFNYSIGKISFKELKDYRDSALETYHI